MKIGRMFSWKKMLIYFSIISLILTSESSMPIFQTKNAYKPKPWLITGIRISCANKRKLYLTYRKSNNPIHKEYYKSYCQTLSKVIMLAKKNSIIIIL